MPLYPGKEALDDPASLIPVQPAAVLGPGAHAVGLVRRDHLDAILTQVGIQRVTVAGVVANQILRLRFDHVELEAQLHQRDLMMVRGMRADRQRQPVTIDNRRDFHAFSALGRRHLVAAAFGRGKGPVDEAFRFIRRVLLTQGVHEPCQRRAQDLVPTPLLEAAVDRLVVRIGPRKHVPLRAGIEDPQHRLKHAPRRNRLAPGSIGRTTLLRKVLPDQFTLLVAQAQHA